jgi:hypothetical protein
MFLIALFLLALNHHVFIFSVGNVFKLDTSVEIPRWRYVTGTNATNSGNPSGQPQRRYGMACSAAPVTGAFCHGGYHWVCMLLF